MLPLCKSNSTRVRLTRCQYLLRGKFMKMLGVAKRTILAIIFYVLFSTTETSTIHIIHTVRANVSAEFTGCVPSNWSQMIHFRSVLKNILLFFTKTILYKYLNTDLICLQRIWLPQEYWQAVCFTPGLGSTTVFFGRAHSALKLNSWSRIKLKLGSLDLLLSVILLFLIILEDVFLAS